MFPSLSLSSVIVVAICLLIAQVSFCFVVIFDPFKYKVL